MVRLQKFLADAGVASRRASEQIILAGRVTVNGRPSRQLGAKIDPGRDEITVDGNLVRARRKIYVALHKPRGFLCTRLDPEKRTTVADLLPQEWQHLSPVGRLDRESEGLIFLTNDGDFALRLTHPRYGVRKIYQATVEGRAPSKAVTRLLAGIEDCGDLLKAERARILSANNSHSVLELELGEGKNREVRRMLAALDLNVVRLQRIQIGRIKLGELPTGKWRTLTEPEIKSLLSPL
ncbi:MAG: rRNA synthase [Verrucomicrobiota bacterium]|jgi:pseudouridine synthase